MINSPTTVIAEAGVNHNGSLEMALELVDAAAGARADVIKFQTFRAEHLATGSVPKAAYQKRRTNVEESQLDMLLRLELSVEAHKAIIKRCSEKGIRFLSTPFDLESLRLLTKTFQLEEIKVASGEITNAPLLLEAARSGCRLILSTGMATLAEVEQALGVIAFGFTSGPGDRPNRNAFEAALRQPQIWESLAERVTLLHCTTEYPADAADTNLKVMDTMKAAFGLEVGFSDHTEGAAIALAAIARGASVIEKHFTLDRSLPGPDHTASLEPAELEQMIRDIRRVEASLGSGIKQPCRVEVENMLVSRKSIVAARPIRSGQVLVENDMAIKRPGSGRSPMDYWDVVGTLANRDFAKDEPLDS